MYSRLVSGNRRGGRIDRRLVENAVKETFERYLVEALWADPFHWQREIQEWQATYGEDQVVEFATNQRARWSRPCALTYAVVKEQRVSHDGNPDLARHIRNAVSHESETRGPPHSGRRTRNRHATSTAPSR